MNLYIYSDESGVYGVVKGGSEAEVLNLYSKGMKHGAKVCI